MKVARLPALRTGRIYSQEVFLVLISVRGCRPQGHSAAEGIMSMKNSVTLSGIEPATFRLLAQCLNQLRHRVPRLVLNNNLLTYRLLFTIVVAVVTIVLSVLTTINL